MKKLAHWAVVAALSVALAGCGGGGGDAGGGGGDTGGDSSASSGSSGGRTAFPADKATGSIKGMVKFSGDKPTIKKIRIQGDEFCQAAHSTPPDDETYVFGDNDTLQNVFVYVKKGAEGWDFEAPTEPVMIDQKGCTYVPHVFGIQAGQPLKIRSSDDTKHNVHFIGKKNKEFNFSQTLNQENTETLKREEVMAYIKCDVHSWMKTWVGILYHPFFAVTGSDGSFDLGKLPPGDYEVAAWHEGFKSEQTKKVTLGDGATETIEFTFSK